MTEKKDLEMQQLLELLEARQYVLLMQELDALSPMDAAEFFAVLPPERLSVLFRLLKKDSAAAIFAEVDPDIQERIIEGLSDKELSAMLEELFIDDAVDMLEEMPAGVVARVLKTATRETREEINRFLSYPEKSAGSVMTSELIDLRADMTAGEAIDRIRRTGLEKETVYVAYVTDRSRKLCGAVELKHLLFADPGARVSELMDPDIVFAHTQDDRETVANLISRYDMIALPVVDMEDRLVGIVTVDDALDVLESEATEDMELMAAILPTEKPYLKTGIFATWKSRVPWLLFLMLSATLTGLIITRYEAAIGTYAVLTAFVPMLMNTGGNAGGQTSVMIIRGLSLGEIEMRDIFRVLWKELRVGFLCGITLAAATFLKVILLDFRVQFTTENLLISLVIGLTVLFAIPIAKMVGTLLPLGAKRIGLDPAVMASPFISTIVDTVTLMIYFAVASLLLGI